MDKDFDESEYIFVDPPKQKSSIVRSAEIMLIHFLWRRLMATAPRIACKLLVTYGLGFNTPGTIIYILTKALEYGLI